MSNVLAIIPARAGSKGVPGKNKIKLNGKTLTEHAYNVAKNSKHVNEIILSTDDQEIIKSFNDKDVILHKRDEFLSSDTSPIIDSIIHILENIPKNKYDFVLLLQPTSPIRTSSDVDLCIEELKKHDNVNSIISVCKMDDVHPGRMYYKSKQNKLRSVLEDFEETRRQDNEPVYFRNGSIYLTRVDCILNQKSMMSKPISPYVMDGEYLLNIDSPRDKLIAEYIFNYWIKSLK